MRRSERSADTGLLQHTVLYLAARGGSAVLGFAAIAAYTRLLSETDYGRYALVVAGVGLCNMVLYQWLRSSLLRFLPARMHNPSPLLGTAITGFAISSAVAAAIGIAAASVWSDSTWKGLILLAVPLLWALAWFDLTLDLVRSRLRPSRYGLLAWVKAAVLLGVGVPSVLLGLGPYGPLLGLLLGALIAGVGLGWREWGGASPQLDRPLLRGLLAYGVPLTAVFALGFVVSSSDRFLIAGLLSEGAAGIYAASYDVAQQSLGFFMMVVTLAAYPLAVRALEEAGREAARTRLGQNATLLVGVGVPGAVGISLLSPNIARVLLGTGFREQGAVILPWIAVATLLSGLKAFHSDLAFHLGRHTIKLLWGSGIAAAVNLVLNVWWIPRFGILGAAYATVTAYVIGLSVSVAVGRRVFPVPFPTTQAVKIVLASGVMALVLWPLSSLEGFVALALQVLVGAVSYAAAALGLDVGGSRTRLMAFVRR